MKSFDIFEKLRLVQRSLLDLGSQVFRLRQKVQDVKDFNEEFVKAMDALKNLLDEKDVISKEEFESTVDLRAIMRGMTESIDPDQDRTTSPEKTKTLPN
jgi:regulator of replication initiation timing